MQAHHAWSAHTTTFWAPTRLPAHALREREGEVPSRHSPGAKARTASHTVSTESRLSLLPPSFGLGGREGRGDGKDTRMSPEDVTTETTGDSRGRFRRAREPEPSGPADAGTPPESVPPKAKRAGRQMSETTKRILFIIAGILVLVGSVLGFYLTADVFDDRTQVLVAARPIEPGQTVSAVDFGFDQVLIGSIPHMPWTPDAQVLLRWDGGSAGHLRRSARAR